MLVGTLGNSSLSYDGWLRLPELMAQGRFVEWWNTARAMKRAEVMTGRGLLYYSLAHWMPGRLWDWRSVRRGGVGGGPGHYTAVNPARLPALRAAAPLRSIRRDPYFRPRIDTFEARLDALHSVDTGNYDKGDLGGWGIDLRDPTADRRLVEFCLNVPTDQFLYGGRPRSLALRALADRLPAAVLEERKRGYQAVDWRLNLTAAKDDLADRRLRWAQALQSVDQAFAS